MNKQTAQLLHQHFDTAFAAPDGIAKLRELILTLAMQGKLVEQDANDPPASELLKEIEAEKQLLSSSSSPRRRGSSKPLPPIKPEEMPYELPKGWEWVRLGDVLNFEYGDNLPANKRSNSGEFPVYGSNGIVGTHKEAFVNEPCIVIGRKGSAGALNLCLSEGCCVTDVAYYCVPPEGIDLNFCFKLLHILKLDSLGKGIKPGLNRNEAYDLAIAIPPLPEQHRIVARIDQLMTRCDALEKLRKEREEKRLAVHAAAIKQLLDITSSFPQSLSSPPRRRGSSHSDSLDSRLRGNDGDGSGNAWNFIQQHFGELYTVKENVAELRKAILQLAVMGRLAPQDPNDPPASELLKEIEAEKQRLTISSSPRRRGSSKPTKPLPPIKPEEVPYELPEGWEWVRFGGLFRVTSGKNLPKDKMQDGDIPVFGGNGITGFHNESNVEKPTVVIGRVGYYCGSIHLTPAKAWITDNAFFSIYDEERLFQGFVIWLLKTINLQVDTSATAQPVISGSKIYPILIPLPPLPEQHRIVARIDQLLALCDTLDQRIDAATGKQTELLNAVMAGV